MTAKTSKPTEICTCTDLSFQWLAAYAAQFDLEYDELVKRTGAGRLCGDCETCLRKAITAADGREKAVVKK